MTRHSPSVSVTTHVTPHIPHTRPGRPKPGYSGHTSWDNQNQNQNHTQYRHIIRHSSIKQGPTLLAALAKAQEPRSIAKSPGAQGSGNSRFGSPSRRPPASATTRASSISHHTISLERQRAHDTTCAHVDARAPSAHQLLSQTHGRSPAHSHCRHGALTPSHGSPPASLPADCPFVYAIAKCARAHFAINTHAR